MTRSAGDDLRRRAAALKRTLGRRTADGAAPSRAELEELAALLGALPALPARCRPRIAPALHDITRGIRCASG